MHNAIAPRMEARATKPKSYLEDAARTYSSWLDSARTAMRYAESALAVLQREFRYNTDEAAFDFALDILTESSQSVMDIATISKRSAAIFNPMVSQYAVGRDVRGVFSSTMRPFKLFGGSIALNYGIAQEPEVGMIYGQGDCYLQGIAAPEADGFWLVSPETALLGGNSGCEYYKSQSLPRILDPSVIDIIYTPYPESKASPSASMIVDEPTFVAPNVRQAENDQQVYWRGIRDNLQQHFSVSLEKLAQLVGIAYPTLVSLGRRRPHPSTARAVLRLHSLVGDFEASRGREASTAWFTSEGLGILEKRGFDALKRAALQVVYGRVRASGGIATREEPELNAAPKQAGDSA